MSRAVVPRFVSNQYTISPAQNDASFAEQDRRQGPGHSYLCFDALQAKPGGDSPFWGQVFIFGVAYNFRL